MKKTIFFHTSQEGRKTEISDPPSALLVAAAEQSKMYSAKDYGRYILDLLRGGNLYARWRRIQAAFLPALWISRAVRIAWRVFSFVETSAFLLLAVAIVLLALPIAALLSLAFASAAAHDRRRANRRYAHLFRGRRVLAFFPQGERDFFDRAISSLSGEYTVLLVGNIPAKGMDGKRIPLTRAAVCRADGVLLVRGHYYFHLRRTLLREAVFFAAIF